MTSHELAQILLNHPDMPIATHANNHTADMAEKFRVGILHSWRGEGIIIGNFTRKRINYPNDYITTMLSGDVPENWR